MGLIRRIYSYLDEISFRYLFQGLVRSHLEYAAAVRNSHKICDTERLESDHRRAMKQIPSLSNLDYTERLKRLKKPTLKYRR